MKTCLNSIECTHGVSFEISDEKCGGCIHFREPFGKSIPGKAEELIYKFGNKAVDVVEEIIDSYHGIFDDFILKTEKYGGYSNMTKFWEDVKKELLNKK